MAEEWKHNSLFRVLAFLDLCGVQPFDLKHGVADGPLDSRCDAPPGCFSDRGCFHSRVRDELFRDGTPIRKLLLCGVKALRRNVFHSLRGGNQRMTLLNHLGGDYGTVFCDEDVDSASGPAHGCEAQDPMALLEPSTEKAECMSNARTLQLRPDACHSDGNCLHTGPPLGQQEFQLHLRSSLLHSILNPRSLQQFDDALEDELPLSSYHLLRSILHHPLQLEPARAVSAFRSAECAEEADPARSIAGGCCSAAIPLLDMPAVTEAGDSDRNDGCIASEETVGSREVASPSTTSSTSRPLAEQFLIDALDEWMRNRTCVENDRLLVACGVLPSVIAHARRSSNPVSEGPPSGTAGTVDATGSRGDLETCDAIIDFVIDVIFPPHPTSSTPMETSTLWGGDRTLATAGPSSGDKCPVPPAAGAERVEGEDGTGHEPLDWLIASYDAFHEVVDVDEWESLQSSTGTLEPPPLDFNEPQPTGGSASTREGEGSTRSGKRQRGRESAQADGGETDLLLTEENLSRFLRERPSVVPQAILREVRRTLADPAITQFEVENHYTLAEIREFFLTNSSSLSDSSSPEHDVDAWRKKVNALKKKDLVKQLLKHYHHA